MCLAIPGKVLEVIDADDELSRSARVSFGGVVKHVNMAYVPEARVGDYVAVHVGFALSVIDEDDARLVFEFLAQQQELDDPSGVAT